MTREGSKLQSAVEGWDAYWRSAHGDAAFTGGGDLHPTLARFWTDYFSRLKERRDIKIIDLASGNGAVVECASAVFTAGLPSFTCVDLSAAAIESLEKRFDGVLGVVADAAAMPLAAESFDIVTSQFGIEYAKPSAFDELVRVLAHGGETALLMHHRGGVIYSQCRASGDALRELAAARFFPLCRETLEAGFAMLRGASPERYRQAGGEFASSIRAVEQIMMRHGRDVAHGTIVRLYRDVRSIHEGIRGFDEAEVLDWLDKTAEEFAAYARRVEAMSAVAVDEAAFERLCGNLTAQGLTLRRREPLAASDEGGILAWSLIAAKA